MVKKNQNICLVNGDDLRGHSTFHLINCVIDTINLMGLFDLKTYLVVENCTIDNLKIHSCWFIEGLVFKNNIIKNYVDYQMGGHNIKPIILEGNIFMDFFNFFDCKFDNVIELRKNTFIKGTNLLGNKGDGFENTFENGWVSENNIGDVDLNCI